MEVARICATGRKSERERGIRREWLSSRFVNRCAIKPVLCLFNYFRVRYGTFVKFDVHALQVPVRRCPSTAASSLTVPLPVPPESTGTGTHKLGFTHAGGTPTCMLRHDPTPVPSVHVVPRTGDLQDSLWEVRRKTDTDNKRGNTRRYRHDRINFQYIINTSALCRSRRTLPRQLRAPAPPAAGMP